MVHARITYTGSDEHAAALAAVDVNDLSAELTDLVMEAFTPDQNMSVAEFVGVLNTRVPYLTQDGVFFLDEQGNKIAHMKLDYVEIPAELGELMSYDEAVSDAPTQEVVDPNEVQGDINSSIEYIAGSVASSFLKK